MLKAVQQIMLGRVTGNEKEARETLRCIRDAGYDAIELNGFMIRPSSLMVRLMTRAAGMPTGKGGSLNWKALLDEAELGVAAVHEDLGTIERDIAAVIKEARDYRTNYIVVTGMYRFDYGSEEALRSLAGRLNDAGAALRKEGIFLLYHNHNCEFLKLPSGVTAYQFLLDHTDPAFVNFEFDSYWPTEAGADALSLMQTLGDRMKLWHINDRGSRVTGQVMTPILKSDSMELGYGNLNLEALAAQAKSVNVDAVILESHKNWVDKSPIASLQKSAAFLNAHF